MKIPKIAILASWPLEVYTNEGFLLLVGNGIVFGVRTCSYSMFSLLSQADDIPRYRECGFGDPQRQKQCNHVSRVVFMFSGDYIKQYIDVM